MSPGIEARCVSSKMLCRSRGKGGCICRPRAVVVIATLVFLSSVFALEVTASSSTSQEGVESLRNAPSVAISRNDMNLPPLHSPLRSVAHPVELQMPTKFGLVASSAKQALPVVDYEDDVKGGVFKFDDNNATLSDHTFQELIRTNQHLNAKPQSNSFLVKLSSYLFNKNSQEKSIKISYDPTNAYTPQPLSFNTPNPPSTIPKPFVHPAENHPPFEDYLGPIQFQSSLTQSVIHNREIPGSKNIPIKEPSTTSLYVQWDRDSAEQEVEAEKNANLTFIKPMWFLLALSGNETIAKLRRDDFIKYVRVNVASRLSMQYDEVKVLKLQLSPRILMNISIASSLKSPVMALLAADTAPLLELSGEEYIIAPLEDPATAEHQTGVVPTSPEGSQDDLEAAVCALAGGACALAAGAALLVAAIFRRQRPRNEVHINRVETLRLPPAVIYTGRLENNECKDVQVLTTTSNLKIPAMDPRVQPDTLPLDARFVEELGLDNPNFLTP